MDRAAYWLYQLESYRTFYYIFYCILYHTASKYALERIARRIDSVGADGGGGVGGEGEGRGVNAIVNPWIPVLAGVSVCLCVCVCMCLCVCVFVCLFVLSLSLVRVCV